MTIWMLCHFAGSLKHGMNYRPYFFAREFLKAGHRVVVASASYSHQFVVQPETAGRYTRETIDGLEYVWIRAPKFSGSADPKRVLNWAAYALGIPGLKSLGLPKPDAIIVSSPTPYAIWPAASLARSYGARLCFDVRDIWPLSLTALGGYSERHPFIRLTQAAEDFAYRRSDLVSSALPGAYEHMRTRGLSEKKFLWISNGVDPGLLSNAEDQEAPLEAPDSSGGGAGEKIQDDEGRPVPQLCFAGSFHARNVAAVFIEAAAILEKKGVAADFHFIGKDSGGKERLKALAAERSCSRVFFHEPIPRSEMQAFLRDMDICLAATRESPLYRFGVSLTKLFDYMLAGKPIILSTNAIGEPVSPADCGLIVPPEDPEAAASAIECLLALGVEGRRLMGERGRRALLADYSYESLAKKWLAALESKRDD